MNVELKQWDIKDKDLLVNLCNSVDRKYLSNRLPYPYTNESAEWWLNRVEGIDGKDGIFRAIVVDGEYIGNISVELKEDVYQKDCEIGYFLLDEHAGKGIMTQAVSLICELSFSQLDILRISGLIYEPNVASAKILERNGFILEGTLRNAVFKNGNVYNLKMYGKVL